MIFFLTIDRNNFSKYCACYSLHKVLSSLSFSNIKSNLFWFGCYHDALPQREEIQRLAPYTYLKRVFNCRLDTLITNGQISGNSNSILLHKRYGFQPSTWIVISHRYSCILRYLIWVHEDLFTSTNNNN